MPLALAVCVANLGFSQTDSSRNSPLDRLCSRDTVCGGSFKDGLCGMLLCIAGIFPQYIFYVPAYLLLIRYYYRYPQVNGMEQKQDLLL